MYPLSNVFRSVIQKFPIFLGNNFSLFISKGNYWLIESSGVSFYFIVPAREYLSNFMEQYEHYSKVRPGYVVFDVGASIGEQTVTFAKKVGNQGLVVAVEPSVDRVSYLRKNISLNGLGNVRLLGGYAIWSSKGTIKLRTNNLSCTVGPQGFQVMQDGSSKQEPIETLTLDDIADNFKISKIDFLKLDCEGSEVEALKGATLPINYMAIETHKIGGHKTTRDVVRLLKMRNYEISVKFLNSELDMVYAKKS